MVHKYEVAVTVNVAIEAANAAEACNKIKELLGWEPDVMTPRRTA